MRTWKVVAATGLAGALVVLLGSAGVGATAVAPQAQGGAALSPAYLDELLAPIALYPDPLLAQILLCSGDPSKVGELSAWLKQMSKVKGSALQEAAQKAGFEPSFVALAPFPQVVELMAGNLKWTSQLGGAFAVDRAAVFESIQRLRAKSQAAGNLKSTPQQTVETQTTRSGEQVIVIEPANPQVVYVPQYNPQVVYTQPAPTTEVVHEESNDDAAVAGAVIGFAAGIAIGAAIHDDYYYGPYGWHGGAHMYNDAWDDYYDHREDAREDYYENREDAREDYSDHREDMAGERSDRAQNAQEQRGERQQSRGTPEAQAQREQKRTDAQQARSSGASPQAQGTSTGQARTTAQQARGTAASAPASGASASSYESRGRAGDGGRETADRSGTRSDAFSGYSSGKSTRSEKLERPAQPVERGRRSEPAPMSARYGTWLGAALVLSSLTVSTAAAGADVAGPRTFATPDEAVRVLVETVKAGELPALVAIFGPEGQGLVDSSDPATGRRNREVFLVAMAEGWRIVDAGPDRKELVLGNEDWPFPVPLVKGAAGWSFDAAAGREEILDRRIGRNELAVIAVLRTFVGAQRLYARTGHDGKPAGLYARRLGSDPGTQNGLYWPAGKGERLSPLGELVAHAAQEGYRRAQGGEGPSPFHGYYFRILEGAGQVRERRRHRVRRERRDVRRLRARRLARPLRRLRDHDLRREPGRCRVREGPRAGDRGHGRGHHALRPRRHLAPGAGRRRRHALTTAAAGAAATPRRRRYSRRSESARSMRRSGTSQRTATAT